MAVPQEILDIYFAPDSDASPARLARHQATDLIRAISNRLLAVDTEAADLGATIAALESAQECLRTQPVRAESPARARNGDGRLVERSPVSGQSNPVAPPLALSLDGARAVGTAVFDERYEGPPGHVHGGVVSAALDEILGVGQIGSGQVGPTGELTIRFHRPTPLHRTIRFESWVEERAGRKVRVRAEVHDADTLLAEATGLFIAAEPR